MPRQGVPYPERLMCSLKCELKNIWSALNGKLHSVNGVEGDGSGDVKIVSGDAAIVVTPDASLNQIEVSLDRSQLPSAAVTSVNGETGAVVLDADDIAGRGAGNSVMDNIITLESGALILRSDLNDEITARGNADAALQTNINAEALTRSSDDAALQNQIDALPTDADVAQAVQNGLDNYAPMMRTTGNQPFSGIKTSTGRLIKAGQFRSGTAVNKWYKLATMAKQFGAKSRTLLFSADNDNYATGYYGLFFVTFGASANLPAILWLAKTAGMPNNLAITSNGGSWEIWGKTSTNGHNIAISLIDMVSELENEPYPVTPIPQDQQTAEDAPITDTITNVIQ